MRSMRCNSRYFWSATQQMSLCVPALLDMLQFPITLSGQLHQAPAGARLLIDTSLHSEYIRERERWEKGLRNETSKSNREDEMGWSKDLKASTTDRGAVLRSETYTLVLSSPSSSSSILHLGPVGLCSHLLSLSLSLSVLSWAAGS